MIFDYCLKKEINSDKVIGLLNLLKKAFYKNKININYFNVLSKLNKEYFYENIDYNSFLGYLDLFNSSKQFYFSFNSFSFSYYYHNNNDISLFLNFETFDSYSIKKKKLCIDFIKNCSIVLKPVYGNLEECLSYDSLNKLEDKIPPSLSGISIISSELKIFFEKSIFNFLLEGTFIVEKFNNNSYIYIQTNKLKEIHDNFFLFEGNDIDVGSLIRNR